MTLFAIACTPDTDRQLAQLCTDLSGQGHRLAGVVQMRGRLGEMILTDAGGQFSHTISQDLGPGAGGCRLDPAALEQSVQQVAAALPRADVLFVNRFGRQEQAGRGFVPLIADALDAGKPVVIAVAQEKRAAFDAFAGALADWTTPDQLAHAVPLHLARKTPG